jgi:hypothetical protein
MMGSSGRASWPGFGPTWRRFTDYPTRQCWYCASGAMGNGVFGEIGEENWLWGTVDFRVAGQPPRMLVGNFRYSC